MATLIFEAILIGCVERTTKSKEDDALSEAAGLFKVDAKALRAAAAKEVKEKAEKKRKRAVAIRSRKPLDA